MSDSQMDWTWIRLDPNFGASDEETTKIFAAVGSALSAWTLVEYMTAQVFLTISHPDGFPAGIPAGFASITSYTTRLKVISETLKGSLVLTPNSERVLNVWGQIYRRCQDLSGMRNEVAHGIAASFQHIENGRRFWVPFFELSSLTLEVLAGSTKTHPKSRRLSFLTVQDIRDRDAQFAALYKELGEFIERDLKPLFPPSKAQQISVQIHD